MTEGLTQKISGPPNIVYPERRDQISFDGLTVDVSELACRPSESVPLDVLLNLVLTRGEELSLNVATIN